MTTSRAAALTLTMATGCPRDIPPPTNAIKSPGLFKAAVDARAEQIRTARFKEVVLEYFGEDERVKVRQLILVEQPDRLMVQTRLPGTNEVMSMLVSDGEAFSVHQRDTNTYYTGRPTRENINELLPLDLSARDVTRVMFGGAPWDRFAQENSLLQIEWDRKEGNYRAWVETRRGGELSMAVRANDFAVTSVTEKGADGATLYRYTSEDWEGHGEVALPRYRRFVWPAKNLDFSLDVGETQVDVSFPENMFKFPPPEGSQVIRMGD